MSNPQQENHTIPPPPSYEESFVQHSFEDSRYVQDLQPLTPKDDQIVRPAGQTFPTNPSGQPQPGGPIEATQAQYFPPQAGSYSNQMYQPEPISHQYTSTTVIATQPSFQPVFVRASVPDYAFLAWFSCLCCFWPVGVCAIIKSQEVNSALAANDIERAQISSNDARRYANISVGVGIVLIIVGIVLRVIISNAA